MSFNVLEIDPDPWSAVLLLAALWCLPAAVFAFRRQLSPEAPLRRQLAFPQWILCIAALVYNVMWIKAFDPSPELLRFGLICGISGIVVSAIALALLKVNLNRASGGVD